MRSAVLVLTSALLVQGVLSAQSLAEHPVTLADGDLKVTVRELSPMPPLGGGDPDNDNETVWTRVRLKLDWGGRPLQGWALADVMLTDARGMTYKPQRTSNHFNKDGDGQVSFCGPLWSRAEPWRVRLEFARTSPYQPYEFWKVFREDEILTVRGLAVPGRGEVLAGGRVAEAQGARVQFLGFAGPNAEVPGSMPFRYPNPSIHYRVERPKDVHVTFLRATDAAGKPLKLGAAAHGYSPTGEQFAREIQVPDSLREVYLAFAVHKSRVFEFSAKPSP